MGIDISDDKKITLNIIHDKRLITNPKKNPKIWKNENLTIKSIYKRVKSKNDDGDGNPMIYALKEMYGYKINRHKLGAFRPSFYEILKKILNEEEAPTILSLPSKSPISYNLARVIARKTNGTVVNDYFLKITIVECLKNFDVNIVKAEHKKTVNKKLASLEKMPGHEIVSLKDFPRSIRHYFSPIIYNKNYDGYKIVNNIILVDDLYSTGTTLNSAVKILEESNIICDRAICLLSGLD